MTGEYSNCSAAQSHFSFLAPVDRLNYSNGRRPSGAAMGVQIRRKAREAAPDTAVEHEGLWAWLNRAEA
jgi:hypothetical protein